MSLLLFGIIVFIIVISITGLLWRVAKKAAFILIIVTLVCSFGTNSYIKTVKAKVITPIEKSMKNVNSTTVGTAQKKFKSSLGALSKFASVDTVNNGGKSTAEFKVFGIVLHKTNVDKK